MDNQQGPTEYSTWNSDQCYVAAWMGRQFGGECMAESILYSPETATALLIGCVLSVCLILSHVQLFSTPWTVAHQGPLSMEFSRQECWGGLPFSIP